MTERTESDRSKELKAHLLKRSVRSQQVDFQREGYSQTVAGGGAR